MSAKFAFTRENIDFYFKAVAREYRKQNGTSMPAEIILIGGASILVNYGFRASTYDIDAVIHASSSMKDSINKVGDMLGLPYGWLNSDFRFTKSYSDKLTEISRYYKTFSNVLTVRTVTSEYLIAMKLMSGRRYKNDISDIIGIIKEEAGNNNRITFEKINEAVCRLYGSWDNVSEYSRDLCQEIFNSDNLESLYQKHRNYEISARSGLITFEKRYPDTINDDNLDDIIEMLNRKNNDNKK